MCGKRERKLTNKQKKIVIDYLSSQYSPFDMDKMLEEYTIGKFDSFNNTDLAKLDELLERHNDE